MSISERPQETERPSLSRQPQQQIPSSGLAPTPLTAMLPNCVGNSRSPGYGQSVLTNHDQLVFAVYEATKPTCRSGYAWRDGTDHRFVEENVSDEMLLKHVAGGDKAAMHILFARHRTRVFHFIQRMVRNSSIA